MRKLRILHFKILPMSIFEYITGCQFLTKLLGRAQRSEKELFVYYFAHCLPIPLAPDQIKVQSCV